MVINVVLDARFHEDFVQDLQLVRAEMVQKALILVAEDGVDNARDLRVVYFHSVLQKADPD